MRRIAPFLVGLGLMLALGCYTDDTGGPTGSQPLTPVVQVHLTDAPFPFDTVQSVDLYIDSIEATTSADSMAGPWVTIAAPHHSVNLLNLQQGVVALLGQGKLDAGLYQSVRMTIDADSSSITFVGGAPAGINWPRTGRMTLYALVLPAFSVADSGADLVLDFDVGRSFPYDLYGDGHFGFIPWLRAVNSAEAGSIEGTVSTNVGGYGTVAFAEISVAPGNYLGPLSSAPVLETGRADANGHYRIAYLTPGSYTVFANILDPTVGIGAEHGVNVTQGAATTADVVLPAAGGGTAGVHIAGPTTVGVGGSIILVGAVTDSQGDPVSNPSIVWTVSDTSLVTSVTGASVDSLIGRAAGSVVVRAAYGPLSDSVTIQVEGGTGADTVASVAITPPSATVSVGDSVGFYARPYNATGTELFGRPMGWFVSDTTVVRLYAFGQSALIQPLKAGTVTLTATSGGKSATAPITVH